jgi:hypothetical protein
MQPLDEATRLTRSEAASKLLEELKSDQPEQWYYISVLAVDGDAFHGGFLLKGHGFMDAWFKLRSLGWCPHGFETLTGGPLSDYAMSRIPEEMRYRRLSREECFLYVC